MSMMASQITSVLIVCLTVCSWADQSKHQSSTLLAFLRGIHLSPVDSPHKGPVTQKMFLFDDIIMIWEREIDLNFDTPGTMRVVFADASGIQNYLLPYGSLVLTGHDPASISISESLIHVCKPTWSKLNLISIGSGNGLVPISRWQ